MNLLSKAALCACAIASLITCRHAPAQSAHWQEVIWGEPQVGYLLAEMTLGGSTKLYRDYATTDRINGMLVKLSTDRE